MGIKDTIKKLIKKEPLGLEPTTDQQKIWRYWSSAVKRAKKSQPSKKWEAAQNRFAVKNKEDRPFVNDTRKQHEASMSFLDQQDASFKITPSEVWMNDVPSLKAAECDSAYIKRIWVEQKCQKACSRKLNDALLINNGTTLPEFDLKKWMPNLRFLPQQDVLIDPDCGGIRENANWEGYYEDVSLEEFRSWHKKLPEAVFVKIAKTAGSVLEETERSALDDIDIPMYQTIKVAHIFARNSAAIRKEKEEDEEKVVAPDKKLAAELQLTTPRRYMQLVDGWHCLLVDEPAWPHDLDHDEFPTTTLQFNQLNGDTYGFTDHQQMERLDVLGDDVMGYLARASFWAAVQKFGGSSATAHNQTEIENFLNSSEVAFLPSILGPDGKPSVVPLQRGAIDSAQMEFYKLLSEQVREASSLSETLSNADAQTFKDVTALAANIADANMHQRINRRLGGPWGYEQSIAEDAIKMLEIAHQNVPIMSEIAMVVPVPTGEVDELTGEPVIDEMGQPLSKEKEQVVSLPWEQAKKALSEGGELIKLGVDAIVGPELAQYWPYKQPAVQWRLNTKVVVEPGTTRSVTRQQQAASMKQLYLEMFQPFYQIIMQYNPVMGLNFMRGFLEFVGRWAQVPNIEAKLPGMDDLAQMVQDWMQQQQQQQQGEIGGEQPIQ